MDSTTEILTWLRFSTYPITVVVATFIAVSTRRGLSYWPATSVLGLTHGARSLYSAIATFPPFANTFGPPLRDPAMQGILQLLVLGGCVWAGWLILKQNRLSVLGIVDMDGRVHRTTPEQARAKAARALKIAAEVERAYEDPEATP